MTGNVRAQELPGREPRVRVGLDADLVLFSGERIRARIRNLSCSGFYAEAPATVLIGTQLIVEFAPLGPVPAQVRWSFQGRLGALFNGAIDVRQRVALSALMGAARTGPAEP